MNSETEEMPSVVDTFKNMHFKASSGWYNDAAEKAYVSL